GKTDIFKNDGGLEFLEWLGCRRLLDRRLLRQQMHQPIHSDARLLQQNMDSAKLFYRLKQHDDAGQESNEIIQLRLAVNNVNQQTTHAGQRDNLDDGIDQAARLDPFHPVMNDFFASGPKTVELVFFQGKSFDDADAIDRFHQQAHLGDGRLA